MSAQSSPGQLPNRLMVGPIQQATLHLSHRSTQNTPLEESLFSSFNPREVVFSGRPTGNLVLEARNDNGQNRETDRIGE